MISRRRLNLAAWLSITMAVLNIPLFVLGLIIGVACELGEISGLGARAATTLLTVGSVALFVYVFSTLRMLLEDRYAFFETSSLIRIVIVVTIVIAVLSVASVPWAAVETAVAVLTLFVIVPLGIIFIVFGIKLLRLPHNLNGMLKPFSYTAIASGFCFATVCLIPLGVLVSVVNDIILALIFFREIDGTAA